MALPAGWRRIRVNDLAVPLGIAGGPFGSSLGRRDYVRVGVPVIRGSNLAGPGRFQSGDFVYVSEPKAESLSRNIALPGDLVLTQRGTLGQAGVVPFGEHPRYVISQSQMRVRADPEVAHPLYLFAVFQSPPMLDLIRSHAITTGVPHINLEILRNIEICLPPIEEQGAIAATLGALDDKIESNRRQRELIAHLIQAEYAAIAQSVDEHLPLSSLATFTKGVSYKSVDLQASRTALVTLKSFSRDGGYKQIGLKPYVGPWKPAQRLHPGEIAVAQTDLTQSADVVGRAVRVPLATDHDTLVASLDLVIVRPKDEVPIEYLLGVLQDERFRQHCRRHTSGTTVLHLASDALPGYPAPFVPQEVQRAFADTARPFFERHDGLGRENERLTRIRDALLPELLSGRIRVPEAREAVSEVVDVHD